MMMTNETWKPIDGYEGIYDISNHGKVRTRSGKIRTICLDKDGYPRVSLTKCGKTHTFTIHRLVAKAFCENDDPVNKTQVNHKDENKLNCYSDNLEWCDNAYNHAYGTCGKRAGEKTSIRVKAIVLLTGEVEHYKSLSEAARSLGVRNCHISNVIHGRRKVAYGRTWHKDEEEIDEDDEE